VRAVAAKTVVLAASIRRRCGTAARVARIMPVPYSLVMTSTPSRPIASWDRCRPPRLTRVASMAALSWALSAPGRKMASSAPAATLNTAAPSSAKIEERTERSLQNSDRTTATNSGSGRYEGWVVAAAAMAASLPARDERIPGRAVVGGVLGELHVPLLERGLVRRQFGQRDVIRPGELADRARGGAGDAERAVRLAVGH